MEVDPSAPPGFYSPLETVDTPAYHSSESSSWYGSSACAGLLGLTQRRSNSRSGYRLFVRVVESKSTTSRMPSREVVCSYFQNFGPVLDCYLPESATNVAFVCFEDSSSLEHCLSLGSEHSFVFVVASETVSLTVHVSRASPRPDYSVNTDRVFVKGLSSGFVHRNDLKLYFSQFGEVTDVYIPKDKATGNQKRFAFITFREVRQARAALAHPPDAHVLPSDGSFLQVMPAEPRPLSAASSGFNSQNMHMQQHNMQHQQESDDTLTTATSAEREELLSGVDVQELLSLLLLQTQTQSFPCSAAL